MPLAEPNGAPPGAVVALGSNQGDSVQLLHRAMRDLAALSSGPITASSLWRTSPVDCPPGSPDFINAVVLLKPLPGETPESLLEKLQELERRFGRKPKTVLNEARPLDLDLIAFFSERRDTPGLILPHPRAHLRRFVLAPLQEIGPEWILPGFGRNVSELHGHLRSQEEISRMA